MSRCDWAMGLPFSTGSDPSGLTYCSMIQTVLDSRVHKVRPGGSDPSQSQRISRELVRGQVARDRRALASRRTPPRASCQQSLALEIARVLARRHTSPPPLCRRRPATRRAKMGLNVRLRTYCFSGIILNSEIIGQPVRGFNAQDDITTPAGRFRGVIRARLAVSGKSGFRIYSGYPDPTPTTTSPSTSCTARAPMAPCR